MTENCTTRLEPGNIEGKEGGSEAGRRKGHPLEQSRGGVGAYREGSNSSGQQFTVEFGRLCVITSCGEDYASRDSCLSLVGLKTILY